MAQTRQRKPNLTIKEIENALRKTGGFQSRAAAMLGVTRSMISQKISKSNRLKDMLEELREARLDNAEDKLMTLIEKGDLGAICFYLRCHGKQRGYMEKQPIESDIDTAYDNGIKKHKKN